MPRLVQDARDRLATALGEHEFLDRVRQEVVRLHRVVFHASERVDWDLVERSAGQIVMAEVVSRHQGDPLGVFFALRALENSGRSWDAAIRELATAIHSYFTTPLGIVMRQDLFGADAVFISPDALDRAAPLKSTAQPNSTEAS